MNKEEFTRAIYDIVVKAMKYDELMKSQRNKELYCSFCGKFQSYVEKLVVGNGVYICDECVRYCYELIQDKAQDTEDKEM